MKISRGYWFPNAVLLFVAIAFAHGCGGGSAGPPPLQDLPSSAQIVAGGTNLAFGNVNLGSAAAASISLTNTGGSTLVVSDVTFSHTAYSLGATALPLSLGPGQSGSLNVVFTPQAAGEIEASFSVVSNASNFLTPIFLSGTGLGSQLVVNPTSLVFGDVPIGSSPTRTLSLNNVGNRDLAVTQGSLSGGDLSVMGLSFPLTLGPGQSAPFAIQFAPTTPARISSILSLANTTAAGAASVVVSGNGVAPAIHSVDLAWDASNSPGILGYMVYRATISGGPYVALIPGPISGNGLTDTDVQAGQTYYYVVTAVSLENLESLLSNETKTTVPSP